MLAPPPETNSRGPGGPQWAAYSLRTNSMAFDLPIALLAPTILDELCASRCEVCSSAVWKRADLVPRDAPKTSGVM
jgi:hypothetical protein